MSKFTNLLAQARQRQDETDLSEEPEDQDAKKEQVNATGGSVAARSDSAPSPTLSVRPQTSSSATKVEKTASRRQPPVEQTPGAKAALSTTTSKSSNQKDVASSPADSPRRGRPQGPAGGKRSNPDYEQITAYVPRKLHQNVKITLMRSDAESDQKQDFSTLVESLLTDWLGKQK